MRYLIERITSSVPVLISVMLLPTAAVVVAQPGGEVSRTADIGEDSDASMPLVFADDFSTDPNTNGLWTIHRYAGDADTEASWDATDLTWHLTRAAEGLGVAVFANYDLTAHDWKAQFRYKVGELGGVNGGGDGFVFMFYKDKDAYGTPEYGWSMGFEQVSYAPVRGYGLQFDNYFNLGCDPSANNHIAIIKDKVCHSAVAWHNDTRTADDIWHTLQFSFAEGKMSISIDGETALICRVSKFDYSFSGIGFSAGTGSAFEDVQIDDFQLWVRD